MDCMKSHDENKNSVVQALLMVSQFSLNMLVPIGMMCMLGVWLDKSFETNYWVVILFFVGAVAGGQNVFRMAKRIYGNNGQNEEQKDSYENSGNSKK